MNLEVNSARASQSSRPTVVIQAETVVPAHSILPVDPGFSIESHMYMRQVKGEDIAFSYRADPSLLGRPMPTAQAGSPEEWKLNFDVFVLCDGHSGSQVCATDGCVHQPIAVIQTCQTCTNARKQLSING